MPKQVVKYIEEKIKIDDSICSLLTEKIASILEPYNEQDVTRFLMAFVTAHVVIKEVLLDL